MRKYLPFTLLIILIIIVIALIHEILIHEPEVVRNRFYNNFKQKGWFDKKVSLQELRKPHTLIILTLGQSNSCNSSNFYYKPKHRVLNYYNGTLYEATEPLIGGDGSGGSVWTMLGDKLIEHGLCDRAVFITIGVGSTGIGTWASGACHLKLEETLQDLQKHNIKLNAIIWHQGESDNGVTPKIVYKNQLKKVYDTFLEYHQNAPFYCSIASYGSLSYANPLGIDTAIQHAQMEFVHDYRNVLLGPNTDTLIYALYRHDSQHFSKRGLEAFSDLLLKSLELHHE
jgi:hypothetical protein